MRIIKFRGKNHQGRWFFGSLIVNGEFTIIKRKVLAFGPDSRDGVPIKNDYYWESYHVDPETVGQFTGLHDKNGKEIYEGDIVKRDGSDWWYKVVFSNAAFKLNRPDGYFFTIEIDDVFEVIGNIHDNLINKE